MSIIQKAHVLCFLFSVFSTEAERVTTFIPPEDLLPSTQPPQAPILLSTPKTTSTVLYKESTSQPSTTKPNPESVTPQQPLTTHQPIFTQPQTITLHSTQTSTSTQVSLEDQYTAKQQLITSSKTTPNPIPTQTNPLPPQSTVQQHPTPPKEQDTITQDNRHTGEIQPNTKPQRLRTIHRSRGTSKHQTTDSYHFYRTTSLYPSSTIPLFEQKPNTKSPPRTSSSRLMTQSTTLASRQDDVVSRQATDTNKQSIVSTKPFIFKEYSTNPHHTTEEPPFSKNEQEPTSHPIQLPSTLLYQSQPSTTTQRSSTTQQSVSPAKHPPSSTITAKQYPDNTKTAKYSLKTESQFENIPPNPKEQLPGTSRNLELTPTKSKPFTKSDDIQDSPVPNEVANRNRGKDVTFFFSQLCCLSPLRVNQINLHRTSRFKAGLSPTITSKCHSATHHCTTAVFKPSAIAPALTSHHAIYSPAQLFQSPLMSAVVAVLMLRTLLYVL